jgi:ribonuclease HII
MGKTAPPAKPAFRTERMLAGGACGLIAGVDEAGRGPWAGPVVAAAVIFAHGGVPRGLNDSKLLSPEERERLDEKIRKVAHIGIGIVDVPDIDCINILQATLRAMQQAVACLGDRPQAILIDGNICPPLPARAVAVVDGDRRCPSIAAASIVAKVTRDRLMRRLADDFPGYGWDSNKGYGTPQHAEAITRLGVTRHHRRSFAPIRLALQGNSIAVQLSCLSSDSN